jgi:hypothetical protein
MDMQADGVIAGGGIGGAVLAGIAWARRQALDLRDRIEDVLDRKAQSLGGIDRLSQDALFQGCLDAVAQHQIYPR